LHFFSEVVLCAAQWQKVERKPLDAPAFYNAFNLKLDAKHRLFIPAEVRRAMKPDVHGTAFFVILGSNKKPWLVPEKYYLSQASQMPSTMSPDKNLLAYSHYKFAMANRIEWDEQGRVVMPDVLLKRAEIQTEVSLAGSYDHLELWNRADWDRHCEQLAENGAEIEAKGMEAMRLARVMAERPNAGGI
jgi:MraZ protein